jgi:hypothetical protein
LEKPSWREDPGDLHYSVGLGKIWGAPSILPDKVLCKLNCFEWLASKLVFLRPVRQYGCLELENASQQETLDRHINGKDVSYVELRRVWGDTSYVGWFPAVGAD